MNSVARAERVASDNMNWGYAFAGASALGFAAVIQFAFGGLDEEALSNLPAIVTVPYAIAGKLGITITLAVVGLSLVARDVLVNQAATAAFQTRKVASAPKRKSKTIADDEELPIAEEVEPTNGKKQTGQKIAAKDGRFEGRGGAIPDQTGGPTGGANPTTPSENDGRMVLSSAKYLNRNDGGSPSDNFRKGSTKHTSDE